MLAPAWGLGHDLSEAGIKSDPAADARKAARLRRQAQAGRGHPCIAKPLANGRCRFHGGMSTGPKTSEGRGRALANLRQNQARLLTFVDLRTA